MKVTVVRYRAIEIVPDRSLIGAVGPWQAFWGTDIFICNIPMIKLMVLANVVMWMLLWVSR